VFPFVNDVDVLDLDLPEFLWFNILSDFGHFLCFGEYVSGLFFVPKFRLNLADVRGFILGILLANNKTKIVWNVFFHDLIGSFSRKPLIFDI